MHGTAHRDMEEVYTMNAHGLDKGQ